MGDMFTSTAPSMGDGIGELFARFSQAINNGAYSVFDPDAKAFFTAAGITDPTQQEAVNQFVLDLKAASIWSKFSAIYPFVGGAATPHSYNLANPATFQITWGGTVTHNSNGITGDGITGYGDTGINPSVVFTNASFAASVYSRSTGNFQFLLGALDGGVTLDWYGPDAGVISFDCWNQGANGRVNGAVSGAHRLLTMSRQTTSLLKCYQVDSVLATNTGNASGDSPPNETIYLLAANLADSVFLPSAVNYAFASFGTGLSDADVTALNSAVVAFETTLGRNV